MEWRGYGEGLTWGGNGMAWDGVEWSGGEKGGMKRCKGRGRDEKV